MKGLIIMTLSNALNAWFSSWFAPSRIFEISGVTLIDATREITPERARKQEILKRCFARYVEAG